MRRVAPLLSLLVLLPLAPGLAQESRPTEGGGDSSGTLRVAVDVASSVDGEPEELNSFQYYTWRTLHKFGLRVDSEREIGKERLDDYVAGQARKWAKREPDAGPASLVITGRASCSYDASEFFGQGQAHNYKGTVHLEVRRAATDETVATFDLEHSWGRLPNKYTQRQVLREYNDMVFTTVILGVLCLDEVRSELSAEHREELDPFVERESERILEPLRENMSDCEVAQLLRSLTGEEGEAEGDG